jgi:hypothetical protein
VADASYHEPTRFPWFLRAMMIVVGLGLVALLVTAGTLEPDSRGFGTHQGLGLPGCTVYTLFGIRCPSCGMTTSWSHLMRGQVVQSLRANSGGFLLGLCALVMGPWLFVSGLKGRWLIRPADEWTVVALAGVVIAVTFADWMLRVWVL